MSLQKKRLIEVLSPILLKYRFDAWENSDKIVEELLAEGVIFPPLKEGETFYRIVDMSHTACKSFVPSLPNTVEPYGVVYRNALGSLNVIPFEEFNKKMFRDKESAKAALENNA